MSWFRPTRAARAPTACDGKANAMLIDWLADELGLPRRCVQLLRGDSSRRKQIALDAGCEQDVARWLAATLG